ncbi:hypothetical protein [Vacuolonema iberomarrocanum]|uniref:hypothetical protein n=1 Tax=Vacuolonema iberomarrocanum TaxID=3454632 RepID=UPI001A0276E3|nr:hypothetical protein [filamentous cyanobacterium LEGE 07170]
MSTRYLTQLTGLALVLFLNACAVAPSQPTAPDVQSEAVSQSDEVSQRDNELGEAPSEPIEGDVPAASLEQAQITFSGIGPVQVGMTLAEAEVAAGIDLVLTSYSDITGQESSCAYARSSAGPPELAFMMIDDRIARVDINAFAYQDLGGEVPIVDVADESQIETPEGIGLGTVESEVIAAYPDAEVTPHEYTDGNYITITDPNQPDYRIVFETAVNQGNQVMHMRSGRLPEVGWIEGCS